jgi:nucleoside-diphosphate kinase
MERTLIIIKPDALSKRLVGKIIAELEKTSLRMVAAKMMILTEEQAGEFYREHREKPFYKPLLQFLGSNPVLVMVWKGDDAVGLSRKLIGATDPVNADEGTIRKMWAQDGRHNIIHGSDSNESAEREINFFFPGLQDIFNWEYKEYEKYEKENTGS